MTDYTCKSRFLHNPRINLHNEVQNQSVDEENGLERYLESVRENMQYHCDQCEQSFD